MTIINYWKNPVGIGTNGGEAIETFNHRCGDEMKVFFEETGGLVDVKFQHNSCAFTVCSASIMVEQTNGKTRSQLLKALKAFKDGEHEVLVYPSRQSCADMPWEALRKYLEQAE